MVPATRLDVQVAVPGVDLRLARRDAHAAFRFQSSQNFKTAGGSISVFFPAKKSAVARGCPCQALNGWTVCRFDGARGGAPEGERNGNYRHGARTKATIELWRFIKSLS